MMRNNVIISLSHSRNGGIKMTKSKGSVMVVDDKGIVTKDIAKKVKNLGYTVPATAASSDDAIEKAGKHRPDMILMDIKLNSKKDGIETADEIFRKYNIPVIYLTAYSDEDTLERAKRTHPYGYIIKPFEEKELEVNLELAFHRLKLETELKNQHECFTTIFNKYPEYLYVADPKTHEVLFVNQKFRDLTGRTMVEGKCYEEFQGRKEPCDFCTNELIMKTGMPHAWEQDNTFLKRHFLITDQIIQWPDGRDVRFETAIDITDQKKIEKILQTTETKYKSFIEQSSYGFYVLDKQGNITFLNDRAKELTGVEMKKNETYGFADFISPEDYETATKNLQALAQGKKFEAARVYNIKRVDGEFRKMEVQSLPIWRDEELIGFHGTIVDVSQKVKFEEELREKTEFLDAVVNHTFDGIIVIDEDFNYKYINPASGRIMGHDPQEWIGKRAGTYRHPDDEKISTEAVFKALSGEPATCEVRVMHSDGEYRLLEMRYSLMMIGDDAHILGMVNDITEKKKVADALVASEEKYRNIVELSPDGIVTLGKTGKILSVNKSFCSLTGFDEHDFIGKNIAKIPTKPKSKIGDTIKVLGQAFKGKELGTIKFKWTHITGEVRDGEARIKKMGRKNDAYFQVVVRDITDEKRVEVALIASEEKYRSLFEFSPDAIVILNLEGRVIECNQSTSKLLEMPMDEIIGHSFEDMGILDEHQVKYYDELFQYLIAGNKVDNNEVELVMKGGQSKWVDTFPSLVTKDGEFYAVQMIARDITSRKLAEAEMRKKLMKFELDHGNLYLAVEQRASQSIEAFKELLMVGHEGTIISRRPRKEFRNKIEFIFDHVKISETDKENHVKPSYKDIHELVSNLPRGHTIHIDCIEYLASRIGAKKTLNLVQYLKDLAISRNLIVLLSIDPTAISEKDLRLIDKESISIVPSDSLKKLPTKLLDILAYIDHLNNEGVLPSYSEIGEYFDLSKPTIRSRIRQLEELGTVKEVQRGRKKILELTEKGKNYMVV